MNSSIAEFVPTTGETITCCGCLHAIGKTNFCNVYKGCKRTKCDTHYITEKDLDTLRIPFVERRKWLYNHARYNHMHQLTSEDVLRMRKFKQKYNLDKIF